MTTPLARSQLLRRARLAAQIAGMNVTKALVLAAALTLSACGGGEQPATPTSSTREQAATKPTNDAEAYRFLTQATFGPTPYQAARLKEIGYSQWIDEQLDADPSSTHLETVEVSAAAMNRSDKSNGYDVIYSWWTHAIRDEQAQLRHRVAFALSEIFVVSMVSVDNGRMLASYLDMLMDKSTGKDEAHTYRDLLEGVAMHPAMGIYLSHMTNQKADGSGRVPDENFAREVMQLFSIGLYDLDDSGQPKRVNNQLVESYNANDIKGLARVFTGFSWMWPASKGDGSVPWWDCFWHASVCFEPTLQDVSPMQGYVQKLGDNQVHESGVKTFLGTTIQAQDERTTLPEPDADLNVALNTLANHPNTAPFISRQLIQRLVTSNPSAAYVTDITRTFRQSGGDLRAVVKAILMHKEARQPDAAAMSSYGKLREPLLRLTHLLRSLPHSSDRYTSSGMVFYAAADTSDPGTSLGQTPMRSPSVFNFFRPGYRPPKSALAAGLVAPEAQIATETSALGYANFVSDILENGWGELTPAKTQKDVQFDFSPWTDQAGKPDVLVDTIAKRLLGQALDTNARNTAIAAITGMPGANATDKRRRVQAAILLVAVSPSFMVQQ